MNRNILVVDTHAILHTVKHSMSKAALSHKNKPTFIMYGFLIKMSSILTRYNYDIVAYAYDSKASLRTVLYPEYKANRDKSKKSAKEIALDEIARPQFDTVKQEIIPAIGWRNRFEVDGLEADDIIAKICKTYTNDVITIATTDGDLYQLLNDRVVILNPKTMRHFNALDFMQKYSIEPKMWKRVKVYGGCTTDNVKGLPVPKDKPTDKQKHIAQGNALNYVKGNLPRHYKAYKAFLSPVTKQIIARNKSLVILPHRKTPDIKIMPDNMLRSSGLKYIAKLYGFKSVLADFPYYAKAFKLRKN